MSRGKILVHGTSSSIKSQYGIGYEFTFADLTEEQIDKVNSLIEAEFPSLSLDLNEIDVTNTAYFIIPISQINKSTEFIKKLEENQIHFGLKSNSLEEAFIKMGEKEHKASSKDLKQTEKIIEEISKHKYHNHQLKIILVQITRRFFLLIKSPVQILILTLMVIFPVFTVKFAFDNFFESFDFTYGYKEAGSTVFMGCVSLLCSVFVFLPGYEREKKIRYVFKKMGVSSTIYFITLFISDMFIGFLMSLLAFSLVSIFLLRDYNINLGNEFLPLVLSNFLWISTFISQSKNKIIKYFLKVML